MKILNKKGFIPVQATSQAVIGLGMLVIFAASIGIALSAFGSSIPLDAVGNTTNGNATLIINNGKIATANFSTQMPTVGTMTGIAVLIVVIVGAFGYFLNQQKQ